LQFLGAIAALLRAIPSLTGFFEWLAKQKKEAKANERKQAKDAAVDNALDDVILGMQPREPEQRGSTDEAK